MMTSSHRPRGAHRLNPRSHLRLVATAAASLLILASRATSGEAFAASATAAAAASAASSTFPPRSGRGVSILEPRIAVSVVPPRRRRPVSASTTTTTELKMTSASAASSLAMGAVRAIRGGASLSSSSSIGSAASSAVAGLTSTPSTLFRSALIGLGASVFALKILPSRSEDGGEKSGNGDDGDGEVPVKPAAVKSLQARFLAVFWILRCADWMQGPYFYEVYSSKVFGGVPASIGLVGRLFLTGFASTALFGPAVGRLIDRYGRKMGTVAFTVVYALGAASTKSPLLMVLLLGRLMSGVGTSLLFSAPESWLVGEAMKTERGGDYLGETFGMVSFF